MINQRKNAKWFLEFLSINFDDLEIGETMKWTAETLTMLDYGSPTLPESSGEKALISPDRLRSGNLYQRIEDWSDGKKLSELHEKIKALFETMVDALDNAESVADKWRSVRKLQKFYSFADHKGMVNIRLETPVINSLEFTEGKKEDSWLYRIKEGALEQAHFRFSITGKNDADTLILYFLKALDGLPIRSLRKCPECGKWFLHTTKRERIYCSNKCAVRKASRDMRQRINADEQSRKEYLKGGRKRAKRAYRKKTIPQKIIEEEILCTVPAKNPHLNKKRSNKISKQDVNLIEYKQHDSDNES